jgi:hypothetical protein
VHGPDLRLDEQLYVAVCELYLKVRTRIHATSWWEWDFPLTAHPLRAPSSLRFVFGTYPLSDTPKGSGEKERQNLH